MPDERALSSAPEPDPPSISFGLGLLSGQVEEGANPEIARALSPQDSGRNMPIYGIRSSGGSGEGGDAWLTPLWSVPWSDLMMTMFVMFAVMFVIQLSERDVGELFRKGGQIKPAPPVQLKPAAPPQIKSGEPGMLEGGLPVPIEEILRLSEKLVAEANLENIDVVLTENRAVKVSVRGPLLFDLGKADLKPEAVFFLDKLAGIIAANNYQVQVVGHTDDFPISTLEYPTNWELSAARAARVARYLIQAGRLEPGRFTVIGHALYRPAEPNLTLAHKSRNRRVEIIITRNEYRP
jgi:chemotaxis protein MotB